LLRARESATVREGSIALVLALELCSLHWQPGLAIENVVSMSLFGDGAAAVLIGNQTDSKPRVNKLPHLLDSQTHCDYQTFEHMAFHLTDHGFQMHLTAYVPGLLAAHVEPFVDTLLARNQIDRGAVRFWGIHPGSSKILDYVQERLGIADSQMVFSRQVLHDYGNMSSPTILFVLDEISRCGEPKAGDDGKPIGAMVGNRANAWKWTAPLVAYIQLGRYPFLVGGFIMYGLGVAIAYYEGSKIDWSVVLWGQIVVSATQLMVHYGNDYFDLEADKANLTPTAWSGGSRILAGGAVPPWIALASSVAFGVFAIAAAVWTAIHWRPGPLAAPMLVLGVFLAWFYSAPPIRLHSRGIGEVSATVVLTVLTPLAAYYLQAGQLAKVPFLAIIPLCFLQFNMIVSAAIPDLEGDRDANKRTIVVLLGRAKAARLYILMLALAYAVLPLLVWAGLPLRVGLAVALSFPLAAWIGYLMWRGAWSDPKKWSWLVFLSIAVLLGSAVLEILAFISLAIPQP
jgi:1,4-dihydroxy-2-naphthoate octaprenyltransferase